MFEMIPNLSVTYMCIMSYAPHAFKQHCIVWAQVESATKTLHMALKMKWHCSIGKHYLIVLKGRSGKLIRLEILDCINGIYESNLNEEKNLFLLNDLCTL